MFDCVYDILGNTFSFFCVFQFFTKKTQHGCEFIPDDTKADVKCIAVYSLEYKASAHNVSFCVNYCHKCRDKSP